MDVRQSLSIAAISHEFTGEMPLASLRDEAFVSRFHAWIGASGRRYIASVYPLDLTCRHAGLPDYDAFVLIPVLNRGAMRHRAEIIAIERESDKRFAVGAALANQTNEWHVHLLATQRAERAAVVSDIAAYSGMPALALSA